ncbi:MAG: hypothetical protein OXL97_01470 [Chloroflexota bacterium]|nr:hypothetical protein [Chloroflexota bacterium]MDE2885815.1 hypothetical protein [Chloroflexota bacterium]
MALTFEIGDESRPRGHAVLYFGNPRTGLLATYVVLLPVKMDMSKYLPPMLAAQLGGLASEVLGEGGGSFAAPPIPEAVESVEPLRRLAELRGDDFIWGGDMVLGDLQAAMHQAAQAVHDYEALYQQYMDANPSPTPTGPERSLADSASDPDSSVQQVVYALMSDRDRLAELSKLVGTMRFALESQDDSLVEETNASLLALGQALPERFWAQRVRQAARDSSGAGARLAQLYVERCYKLLEEDFTAVQALEEQISSLADEAPPQGDIRG